jgi:hemolysin activation/secretion protein
MPLIPGASRIESIGRNSSPLPAPEAIKTPEGKPAKKFRLIGAEIVGSTVYSSARLGDFYEPYLNREISPPEIDAIVKAITKEYRKDGFFLARVIAPPQRVEFGVLRLRIIEGFIEDVVFKGKKPGRSDLFDAWIGRITAENPLKLSTLERNLLLMASIPGLSVTPGVKEKDAERGAYVLEIGLKHSKFDGFATFDNRGTTTVGPLQLYAGVNFNSVVGLLERTRLAVFTIPRSPEELLHFEFQQDHILNSHGTQGWFYTSRSSVETGHVGDGSKEDSLSRRFILGFSHPWIRRRDLNFYTSLKFDAFNSKKDSTDSGFDERLRSVRIGAQFNGNDDLDGTTSLSTEFSKGFDVLHASDKDAALLSRENGRSTYVKATLDVARTQKLVDNWQLEISGSGQWSPHTLLSAEEFAVGGQRFGRGYDPSDISGSQGMAGAAELQYALPIEIPKIASSIQLFGFYDIGAVWGAGFTRESMASAGGGVRFSLANMFKVQLEAAQPLTRLGTPGEADSDGPRFFISLSGRF